MPLVSVRNEIVQFVVPYGLNDITVIEQVLMASKYS